MCRSVLFLLLSLLTLYPALAQIKGLTINGDSVSYDKERRTYQAEGSVEVVYQDILLRGSRVTYNLERQTLQADRGFDLHYEGITIEGERLDYQITTEAGEAGRVKFVYQGIELGGESISFSPVDFNLHNANFTTCDLLQPHYRVTAAEIILYPKHGWLVAYWGFFWLSNVPVVPMPTYIYDLTAEDKDQRNIPPFPEISSNDLDGWYITERLAWHLRRELSGSYTLSYYQKKGFGGGAEANYIWDDNNRGNVRLYGNGGDGYWGGLTHHYFFGGEIGPASSPKFFNLPKSRRYELIFNFSQRERLNYQRVSYHPQLTFKSKAANYNLELMAGRVAEENNVSLNEGSVKLKLYRDLPETPVGVFSPNLGTDQSYYSNGTSWLKNYAGLDLKKALTDNLKFGLGYQHFFALTGTSPFLFELYRYRPADRLKGELYFVYGQTGVGVDASYFLDNWSPEDIDYSLFFRLHCYNLLVKYRSMRGEFNLGFSLMGGE